MEIHPLTEELIQPIAAAFAQLGWDKPAEQYERYLREQAAGDRDVLVLTVSAEFAGYLTIMWQSPYPHFWQAGIPEIVDFNVLPKFRRQGIGTQLMDAAEARIGKRSDIAGIGVGMTADYGAAQILYVRRGYIPDGRGLSYDLQPVNYDQQITGNDSMVLYFTKKLFKARAKAQSTIGITR
jgi:GNAT superfamily N-acetyltransferase